MSLKRFIYQFDLFCLKKDHHPSIRWFADDSFTSFSATQLSQILSWASPLPQKLQNIANTLWLIFQREWMFGKGREKVVGAGNEQNSIQSLGHNAHARCVLFICNVRMFYLQHLFLFAASPLWAIVVNMFPKRLD